MDEKEKLKITIQNRLNEARNNGTGTATVMNSTLSAMLKVLNEITQEELKECPFCGMKIAKLVEDNLNFDGFRFFVMCGYGCCETARYSKKKYAIEAWNRRASQK